MSRVFTISIMFAALLFFVPYVWGETMGDASQYISDEPFTLKLSETGEIITVTPVEYLIGCLYAQIPLDYHEQALKAQAAAAHTYALRYIRNNALRPEQSSGEAQLSDDAKSFQAYYTEEKAREYYGEQYDTYYQKVKEAAEYGAKHVILFAGEPIYAVYHNMSSGITNTGESVWGRGFPYLKSVNSSWDKNHPSYLCKNEITIESMQMMLLDYNRELKIPLDYSSWFTNPVINTGEYVEQISIGDAQFSGGDVWRIFNLRSPAFTASYTGTVFSFETRGYGHGVGLSQYGADYMAKRGYSAEDILSYYYTGIKIK